MKKHHWHAFWHEKLFEKHPQPHCQTRSSCVRWQKWTSPKILAIRWVYTRCQKVFQHYFYCFVNRRKNWWSLVDNFLKPIKFSLKTMIMVGCFFKKIVFVSKNLKTKIETTNDTNDSLVEFKFYFLASWLCYFFKQKVQ